MTITIDLPQETREALRTGAKSLGRPAEQVAAEYFASLFALDEDEETATNTALDELSARFTACYEMPSVIMVDRPLG